ncbi:MAG: GntP family permease [Planctomycetaceae bacterium]|nr:GntP family permease [Planctomycetaceae bacterium]
MISPLVILAIGVTVVLVMIIVFRMNAFLALVCAALVVSLLAPGGDKGERVALALGNAVGKVGLIIAMAAIIGVCMLRSGAAEKIVMVFCRVFGEKRFPLALGASGFTLSIPVFYETVFFLLVPMVHSFYRRTRKNYMLCLMAICAGAMITHTMVPPAPGPLAVAANLGIEVGYLLLIGLFVGALTFPVAIAGAYLINWYMPNPKLQLPASEAETDSDHLTAGEQLTPEQREKQLPSLGWALLPILSPVILIATCSFANMVYKPNVPLEEQAAAINAIGGGGVTADVIKEKKQIKVSVKSPEFAVIIKPDNMANPKAVEPPTPPVWVRIIRIAGDKEIAMMLAAALSMLVYYRQKTASMKALYKDIELALLDSGLIILIIAAGGAFGAMLEKAGIGDTVKEWFQNEAGVAGLSVLIAAFCLASVFKLALGSSTTAMLTASSIIGAMGLTTQTLGFNIAYLALAISAGSLVTSWMNDAGFWLTSRMGGLNEIDTLKSVTVLHIIVGCSGFVVILVLSQLLPFA